MAAVLDVAHPTTSSSNAGSVPGFDGAEAARWRAAARSAAPSELRRLHEEGYDVDDVARVGSVVEHNVVAWTRVLLGRSERDLHRLRQSQAEFMLDHLAVTVEQLES